MNRNKIIKGIKLIYQTGGIRQPEDPKMHYKMEANFRPPEFMQVAFVLMHGGSEKIVVQGKTRKALDQFIKQNELLTHPRLRNLTITGPNGVEYTYPEEKKN
jgi:hypothetical protein